MNVESHHGPPEPPSSEDNPVGWKLTDAIGGIASENEWLAYVRGCQVFAAWRDAIRDATAARKLTGEKLMGYRVGATVLVAELRQSRRSSLLPKPEATGQMSIQISRAITLLILILASGPAIAQKVTYDWDKDTDFSTFRTYKWFDDLPKKSAVETTHQRILANVDAQLQAKSLKKTNDSSADLYVSYQAITDSNGQIVSFNPDGQWRTGTGMTSDASKPPTGKAMKGALVLDIYDQKMKKLIWRGIVAGVFDSRQAVNYGVDKGISKLFSYFPPSPAEK